MAVCRRMTVVAAVLSLTLSWGCAYSRKASSIQGPTRLPMRGNAELSDKRSVPHRAEDRINDVVKRLERTPQRSQRLDNTADRPVSQMGTGTGSSASTTGIVSGSLQSGASSSVVVTQPPGAIDPGGSTSLGTAAGSAQGMTEAKRGTVVGSALVACCLIAAIVWLPRRLNPR
jgi:hypothetical protein